MIALELVVWILFAYLFAVAIYLLAITLASWGYKPFSGASQGLRLGVVIPAHNEEEGIATTLCSIFAADTTTPVPVFVIADNCTDQTAQVAEAMGAKVLVRNNPEQRGKGYALDWFIREHHACFGHLDALCFVDADVHMHPDFFSQMAVALAQENVHVVQGFNGVSNPMGSWRTALTAAAFHTFNHLRPAGSFRLFGSTVLKGNGMAFRTHVLQRYGWPAHGQAEDLEFSIQLAKDGIPVAYQSSAIATSEMTISRKQANAQRSRWEAARIALSITYLKQALSHFRPHMLADLLTPPLSLYVLLIGAAGLLSVFTSAPGVVLCASLVALLMAYVGSAQIQCRAPIALYGALAFSPLFLFWKATLYLQWLTKGPSRQWSRTVRNASL